MSNVIRGCAALSAVMWVALGGAAVSAAEPVTLYRDLGSVIMLLGLPCDEVVGAARQGDNDHLATCRNGNRYRVHMTAAGRVVAELQ